MKEIFSYDARLAAFKELIKKIEYLKYTLNSLVYWDKITYMPPKGIEYPEKSSQKMCAISGITKKTTELPTPWSEEYAGIRSI